jgi:hypothetical protein
MKRFACPLLLALLAACSSTPEYNPTVFPYEIDRARIEQDSIKRVVIAHVNVGAPSRNYLKEYEAPLDRMVADYLEANGYKVVPTREFEQLWKTALQVYGDVYDPLTGEVNRKTFALALINVRDEMLKRDYADAIVFTDLLEQEAVFSSGLQHIARWHGVSRKPTLQGPGEGVSAGFNWNQPINVASLWINIYDMDLKRLFSSIGGLDTTQAIDTRSSSGRFVRRRSMLENESFLQEGIELAFHPFIEMENYPGPPRESGEAQDTVNEDAEESAGP